MGLTRLQTRCATAPWWMRMAMFVATGFSEVARTFPARPAMRLAM
jgi:hypothetical protein